MSMSSLIFTSLMISLMLMFIMSISMKSSQSNLTSKSPFECGFKKESTNKNSFSSQFITITLLFLMFDLEIVMVMPSPLTSKSLSKSLMTATLFMTLLTMALLMEWSKGMMEWKS